MKVVILAAGQGSRLRPLTDARPKGMIELGGETLIHRQVQQFRDCGLDEIAIVTGYKAEAVEDYGARHYRNTAYDSTNMVHSLFCAAAELRDDVIVSYGDILYSESVLRELLASESPVSVVVDLDWEQYFAQRFGDPFEDAESLAMNDDGMITAIGERSPDPARVEAQYIGLMRFRSEGIDWIREVHDRAVASGAAIGWGRPIAGAYMTDLLQELANLNHPVRAVPIRGGWLEIDTLRDYELAQSLLERIHD